MCNKMPPHRETCVGSLHYFHLVPQLLITAIVGVGDRRRIEDTPAMTDTVRDACYCYATKG